MQEEKLKLYEDLQQIVDEKKEHEHFIREIMIRLKGEEERCKVLAKEKAELTAFCLKLKGQLQEQHIKS